MSDEVRGGRFSIGFGDIPWWAGLVALIALIYAGAYLPSEFRPLPIVATTPDAGERNVPVDTAIQVWMEPGGMAATFAETSPQIRLTYEDNAEADAGAVHVTVVGDVVRGVLSGSLQPGRRVRVAIATRYDRDLVWHFYTSDDSNGPSATLLPPLD